MKTALITGAGGGIGQAVSEKLAGAGYAVILHYNKNETGVKNLAGKITASGGVADIIRADLSREEETLAMCGQILKTRKVDVLVNNAGVEERGLFSDITVPRLREVLEVNLISALLITRAVIPAMVTKKSGVIINISSVWGISGASCEAVYSASKAGLIGFTKSLAQELGPSNIRVNAVAPGFVDTPMNAALSPAVKSKIKSSAPLNRHPAPAEIADAILFFINSPSATGEILKIDAGYLR